MPKREKLEASSTTAITVAGGAGMILTAVIQICTAKFGWSEDLRNGISYGVPVAAAIIAELHRKSTYLGGQYLAERKIKNKIKMLNTYLNDPSLSDEKKAKLAVKKDNYIDMLTDLNISIDQP